MKSYHFNYAQLRRHLAFFKITLLISTLGTFATLVLTLSPFDTPQTKPVPSVFSVTTAQIFIALAYILFLLTLLLSALILGLLILRGELSDSGCLDIRENRIGKFPVGEDAFWTNPIKVLPLISGLVFYVLVSALLFCALATIAYTPVPGIIGVIFLIIFIILSLVVWIIFVIRNSRKTPHLRRDSNTFIHESGVHTLQDEQDSSSFWQTHSTQMAHPLSERRPPNPPYQPHRQNTSGGTTRTLGTSGTSHTSASRDDSITTSQARPIPNMGIRHHPIIIKDPRAGSTWSPFNV